MKNQGVIGFCLGVIVGLGGSLGGSYLMSRQGTTDETPAVVSNEDVEVESEKKEETQSEPAETPANTPQGEPENNNEPVNTDTTSSNSNLFVGYEWPEAEFGGAIPQPNFDSKPTMVNVSESLIQVGYDGVSEDSAVAYINELKGLGE